MEMGAPKHNLPAVIPVEKEVEINLDLGGPNCEFSNRLTFAAERLTTRLREHGIENRGLKQVAEDLKTIGQQIGTLGHHKTRAVELESGGQKVAVAATPAGLEYCAELMSRQMTSRFSKAVAELPSNEQQKVLDEVVGGLFPDSGVKWNSLPSGQFADIRLRPNKWYGRNSLSSLANTAFALSLHVFESATINSLVGAMNLLENMTTPAGVQGPQPLKFFCSDRWRKHQEATKAYSLEEIVEASAKAELLVRQCLESDGGIAKAEVSPARALLMEKAVRREHELRDLHEAKMVALKQAFAQDQERVRKEHEAKIEQWRQGLYDEAGIETSEDRAFARKLMQTFDREPLVRKCLTDSILGQPITERLRSDFIRAATKAA